MIKCVWVKDERVIFCVDRKICIYASFQPLTNNNNPFRTKIAWENNIKHDTQKKEIICEYAIYPQHKKTKQDYNHEHWIQILR